MKRFCIYLLYLYLFNRLHYVDVAKDPSMTYSLITSLKFIQYEDFNFPYTFVLQFNCFDRIYQLVLKQNKNLIHESESVLKIYEGPKLLTSRPMATNQIYSGTVYQVIEENSVILDKLEIGWARLLFESLSIEGSVVFEGSLFIDDQFYNIKKLPSANSTIALVMAKETFDGVLELDHKTGALQVKTPPLSSLNVQAYSYSKEGSLLMAADHYASGHQGPKCGHDLLKFNIEPNGAASTYAQSIYEYHHLMNEIHTPQQMKMQSNDSLRFIKAYKDHLNLQLGSVKEANYPLAKNIPYGCPISPKILYMGVAADCSYSSHFSNDVSKIESSILKTWNIVSGIYESTFNIQIGIITILVMTNCSSPNSETNWNRGCDLSYTIEDRLSDFSKWRGTQSSDAGLWHLVTGCPSNTVVGIAWLNQVCNIHAMQPTGMTNWVSGTGVTKILDNMYAVVTHEIGHNFGATHDCIASNCLTCTSDNCPCCMCGSGCDCKGQFIMNPESGGLSPTKFSPCSIEDICKKFPVFGKCLHEPGTRSVIKNNICGNGIKEYGEDCDCGDACDSDLCCNANCTFKLNVQCSDRHDTCCQDCKFISKEANKVCLPKQDDCQYESVCSGSSGDCPPRKNYPDGTACNLTGASCASGLCTNRDLQCRLVGSRTNIIGECEEARGQCEMICRLKSGSCVYLDATFIDGTPCTGGHCYSGKCNATLSSKIASWIRDNWSLVVVLIILASFALGLTILYCFILECKKYRARIRRMNQLKLNSRQTAIGGGGGSGGGGGGGSGNLHHPGSSLIDPMMTMYSAPAALNPNGISDTNLRPPPYFR